MSKKIAIFVSAILLIFAIVFAYLGYSSVDKGLNNVFIVDNELKIEVNNSDEVLIFSFSNLREETIEKIEVTFGIKDDKNYTNNKDEITITLTGYKYNKNSSFDISFDKFNFTNGEHVKDGGDAGYATIFVGTNIVEIGEYDYVHELKIDGAKQTYNHGESKNNTYFIFAAIDLVAGLGMLIYSSKLENKGKETKVEETKKINNFEIQKKVVINNKKESLDLENQLQEEWKKSSNEQITINQPEDDNSYVDNEHTRFNDEEKQKYIDSMDVIDMDKDELE